MKSSYLIRSLAWFLFVTVLFLINICLFFVYHQQTLYLTIIVFALQMQILPLAHARLSYLGFLISLESGIYYGIWGLPLLYLIPAYLLFNRSQQILHITGAYRLIPVVILILLQLGAIEWYILGISPSLIYTISKIFGTLLVVMFFSLTHKSLGTSGNRLYSAYSAGTK